MLLFTVQFIYFSSIQNGQTALHSTANGWSGKTDIAKSLIEGGVNLNLKDKVIGEVYSVNVNAIV